MTSQWNRQTTTLSPAPSRAGVSGDSSTRGDGRGIFNHLLFQLTLFRRRASWRICENPRLSTWMAKHEPRKVVRK